MTRHNVEVWVNYYYGGIHLSFSKSFDLPFVPFVGLVLVEMKLDWKNIHIVIQQSYMT